MRYRRDTGGACEAMIPYYGPAALWIGRLAAQRPLNVSSDRIFADARTAERCFFTEAECRTWLARLTLDWAPRPGFALCEPAAGAPILSGRTLGGGSAQIHALPPAIAARVLEAFTRSFQDMFTWGIPFLVAAFVIALFLKEVPLRRFERKVAEGEAFGM